MEKERKAVWKMVKQLGDRLYREGYRGAFCMDFLIDTDTRNVYLGELNPRVSGASPLTHLVSSTYGGVPIYLFHLLEFMDVDYDIDLRKVQRRWDEFDEWSQLILKHSGEEVELISRAPASGIWHMTGDGSIKFVRRTLDWTNVTGEEEAFYLRVYTAGDYRYHGADLGILVARGRMQTDDRQLYERARQWAAGIKGEFHCVPLPPAMDVQPPAVDTLNKMY
jgi:biotin carboxylase